MGAYRPPPPRLHPLPLIAMPGSPIGLLDGLPPRRHGAVRILAVGAGERQHSCGDIRLPHLPGTVPVAKGSLVKCFFLFAVFFCRIWAMSVLDYYLTVVMSADK